MCLIRFFILYHFIIECILNLLNLVRETREKKFDTKDTTKYIASFKHHFFLFFRLTKLAFYCLGMPYQIRPNDAPILVKCLIVIFVVLGNVFIFEFFEWRLKNHRNNKKKTAEKKTTKYGMAHSWNWCMNYHFFGIYMEWINERIFLYRLIYSLRSLR